MKYSVDYLDLVIIRSCNMSCDGCCTFSDHQKINGLVDPLTTEPALEVFSKFIEPKRLHIFGGEPTMHPKLLEWVRLARKYWPTSVSPEGNLFPTPIWINTNGYYLDKIFDYIDELFIDNTTFISTTHHTSDEPYSSLVLNNYKKLQDLILYRVRERFPDGDWVWESNLPWDSTYKKFLQLRNQRNDVIITMLNITMQHNDRFVPHYKGYGKNLEPWQPYNDAHALYDNHSVCHIKNYVQIYENKLWKCPPRAVLNQTLATYGLQSSTSWKEYHDEYTPLEIDASEIEIDNWFRQQALPEKTCNMCGFMNANDYFDAQQHLPKKSIKKYDK